MSMKKLIISLLVLFVVLGFAYGLHDKFERVSEEVDIGFTGEARSNSLYASRLFLKAMGIPAQAITLYDLEHLPAINTVIVINTYRTTLSTQRIERLLEWVREGGHLLTIVAPDYLQSDDYFDYLQSQLRVSIANSYYLKEAKDDEENNTGKSSSQNKRDGEEHANVVVTLTGLEKTYSLEMTRFEPIKSQENDEERIQIDQLTFLLNRPYGAGMISLISDLNFAENDHIEKYDHAEFFWQLIHRHYASPNNVWLLNSDEMPPLWQWLWQHASALIITLFFLLLLWLYQLSQRFGPLIPHQELDRRRILEHIQASGHFFWKHEQQSLIQSSRKSVLQKFEALFPEWNQLNQHEQLKLVSEHSQLTMDELQRLLYDDRKQSVDEFIYLVQRLEMLRKN